VFLRVLKEVWLIEDVDELDPPDNWSFCFSIRLFVNSWLIYFLTELTLFHEFIDSVICRWVTHKIMNVVQTMLNSVFVQHWFTLNMEVKCWIFKYLWFFFKAFNLHTYLNAAKTILERQCSVMSLVLALKEIKTLSVLGDRAKSVAIIWIILLF
jgi:hypothetical protein